MAQTSGSDHNYDQFDQSLDRVRDAYNKLVQAMRKQQERMKQLESRVAELEKPREQQPGQVTPEHPALAPQPEETHHHTLSLSEPQIRRAIAIGYSSGFQPEDVRKWVKQTYGGKKLEELDRKEYTQLCAILQEAKGKSTLPTLQPGREYSQAS